MLKCHLCLGKKFTRIQGQKRHYEIRHPGVLIPKKQKHSKVPQINYELINKKLQTKPTKLIKKKQTNKNKIIPRTTFAQRKRCVDLAKKDYKKFNDSGQSRQNLSRWKKQMPAIQKLPVSQQRSGNYLLTNETDIRKTGMFVPQQAKVYDDIKERRKKGEAVSTGWIRARMAYHCRNDKPGRYDPAKHKFKNHWVHNFLIRHGLSIRKKTNKKKKSIFEKLHKVKNYHHYCIYELADDDISSEEEESSSSEEEESSSEEIVTSADESD